MADQVMTVDVSDLKRVQREIEQKIAETHGSEMLAAIRTATLLVQRDAKRLAPVDTGRLRASITPSVSQYGETIEGVVGSNVTYAPYMELGTRPHWPPPGALAVWARRHGTSEFLVARAIARRGTKARKFLERAFEQNIGRIQQMFEITIKRIVEK